MTEIAAGSVVSHYRILSPVGEGGMGVVYLAEDITLSRRAALKFLPEKNRTDASVMERFLREARAASALNHPGICTIYEFGEHDGRSFLAMEFLEGKSLDKVETAQPMALDRLLDFGIQAADALDAAHRKGIVHRDIKPANLFLSPSGQLKVLDFGLAKLTEAAGQDGTGDATSDALAGHDDVTAANSLTSAGSAVGTVAYMSPEQARGEKLDARSDLFSLGVVLYQLATGKHPFGGTTTAVIFDRILNHAPTAPLELNATLPVEFGRILNKALDKDPDLRYQSAADMRADLKRLRKETTSDRAIGTAASSGAPAVGVVSGVSGAGETAVGTASAAGVNAASVATGVGVAAKPASGGRIWVIGAVAAVVLAALAFAVWRFMPRNTAFSNVSLRQITDSGDASILAMSPDGKTLALVKIVKGQQSLWIRNLPTNAETQILPPFGGNYVGLAFSVDGNSLYFSRSSEDSGYIRTLYSIPVFGGTPRVLIRDVDSAPSFSPDGQRFVFLRQTPELKDHFAEMHVVNADLSGDVIVYHGDYPASFPEWSPDGKKIAWNELRSGHETFYQIYDVDSKQTRTAPAPPEFVFAQYFGWMPDSESVVATYVRQQSDLVQIGLFNLSSNRLKPITNDLNTYSFVAIEGDGHKFATVSSTLDSELSFYKSEGGTAMSTANLKISPAALAWQDATHIAFIGHGRIDLYDREKQAVTPIDTGDVQVGGFITACADGRIVFTGIPKGVDHSEAFRVNADGTGVLRLTTGKLVRGPQCLTGDAVNYTELDGTVAIAWSIPLAGGPARKLFSASGTNPVAFSRDGLVAVARTAGVDVHDERILAEAHDLAHPDAWAKPLTLDKRWSISRWHLSPDGKALVYPIVERGQWSLFSQPLDGSQGKAITEVSPIPIRDYGWSPDGTQVVVLREQSNSNVLLITDQGAAAH
jgi:eukaryotic-like serine/threonine-protein kinase